MDLYRHLKEAERSVAHAHGVEQDQAEDLVVQNIVCQILWCSLFSQLLILCTHLIQLDCFIIIILGPVSEKFT